MPLQRRFTAGDEELGKKYDDHRRGGYSPMASPLATTFTWRGPRRKRIFLALVALAVFYFFFKNLPNDAAPATRRHGGRFPPGSSPLAPTAPKGPPPRSESTVDNRHYFEGPIKYYNLASSFGIGLGPVHDHRNVLFVVSSLKSAASLVPLACDMSKQNKNRVHLMLTGRDDMAIEDIGKINGVTEADCSITWHDGRPDFSIYSTNYRMEVSVRASLGHLGTVMRPRVVLVDGPEREDSFFTSGMRDKTRELGWPLIELPVNAAERVSWIAKLDSSSLKAWNDINIEILIHSPPESSGSLIRLLKSLENADYFNNPLPRLTIELPNKIDPPTLQYLSNFRWPPGSTAGSSKLTLRHRLVSNQLDAGQASIRQIESFFPSNAPQSNVLVLSPQVELSPLYFHYLAYTLLEYKHSNIAPHTSDSIMGISLERPFTALNGKDSLSLPEEDATSPLFLYQAPNSNAALYFGDKWVELHSFLSNRFAVDKNLQKPGDTAYSISKTLPSWLGYLVELSRARAYTMLYPNLASAENALATIHTELYHLPEESTKPTTSSDESPSIPDSPLTASSEFTTLQSAREPSILAPLRSILHLLNPHPSSLSSNLDTETPTAPLPSLSALPILSHTGQHLPQGQVSLNQAALTYAAAFARELGGCDSDSSSGAAGTWKRPERKPWSADDLFCLDEGLVEEGLGIGERPGVSRMGDDAVNPDLNPENTSTREQVDDDGEYDDSTKSDAGQGQGEGIQEAGDVHVENIG